MQALCGLQGVFLLFNCQTPGGSPSDGDQNNNENTAAVKTPKTGDSSLVFFTVLLALCAGVSAAVVLSLKTKENKIR